MYEVINKAIFRLDDIKDIYSLNRFYKKHVDKDFNFSCFNPRSLLSLSIPLGEVSTLGKSRLKTKSNKKVEDFINWYENNYLLYKDYKIIKHIPHSSLDFPSIYIDKGGFIKRSVFGNDYLIANFKMADLFVDKLFAKLPGIEIKAKYSRLYCDLERYKDNEKEIMSKIGQGYIYTKSMDGKPFNRHLNINGLDIDKDIDSYYENHHNYLLKETRNILKEGKKVLILDLHSFSNGQAIFLGKKPPFPDICIGINKDFNNKKLLNNVIKRIKQKGYSYQINYPYEGSIIPDGLSKQERESITSIMIEVNKRIYI